MQESSFALSAGAGAIEAKSSGAWAYYTRKIMTKPQLIEAVAAQTGMSKANVEAVIDAALEKIGNGLESGERIDFRGFGSFVVKERKARQGRNPKTGEPLTIAAKKDAGFKPGKELTLRLNPSKSEEAAGSPAPVLTEETH
jgi:nucleoid DNA-binding protein